MKLLELECIGVRGLPDGRLSLADPSGAPLPLALVTGPPSAGSTTLLEAVAFSAARLATGAFIPDAADVVHASGDAATIRSTWHLDPDELEFGGMVEETTVAEVSFRKGALGVADADPGLLGLMSRYDHQPTTAKVVYLPARRVLDGGFSPFSSFETDMRTARLQTSPSKFGGLPRALVQPVVTSGDRSRFEVAQKLFAEVCDTVKLVGVAPNGEPELLLPGGARLPLGRAGFSERNIFMIVASFVVMGLGRSVVLLDTPELGLAPERAARLVAALRSYAPQAQLIVATRDPALLASAGASSTLVLGSAGGGKK